MDKPQKQPKFNFEKLKAEATSENPTIRKRTFQEYFERFAEFPSYLFDNSEKIDNLLLQTIQDLEKDPDTSAVMQKGIVALLNRLPANA
jgi:hypothetical protein